jgi:hypothetical protein
LRYDDCAQTNRAAEARAERDALLGKNMVAKELQQASV